MGIRARGRPPGAGLSLAQRAERAPALRRITARHRHTARLIASGYTLVDVAREMDYTPTRISQLVRDPAFEELVAFFEKDPEVRDHRCDSLDLLKKIELQNTLRAAVLRSEVLDEIEESNEPLLHSAKIFRIYEGGADRVGFGKHQINHNQSDFASQLDRTIAASNKAKLVNGTVVKQQVGSSPPLAAAGDRAAAPSVLSPAPTTSGGLKRRA
jgi:DNA-binding CsgD family transcriptional regulator